MEYPLQITFRNMPASEAIEAKIRRRVAKLEQIFDRIIGCRVVVEAPHRHHHKGKIYNVRIDLSLPGPDIVVNREPDENHAYEDAYVAVRDAFDNAQRRLIEYVERMREAPIRPREGPPHAKVARLFPEQNYGFLVTADGREIYFHRNAVVNDGFDKLKVGDEVRFTETEGAMGPQASTVDPVGKEGKHVL